MKRLAFLAACLPAAALAQSMRIDMNMNGMDSTTSVQTQETRSEVHEENGYKLAYKTGDNGYTMLKVLQPEGAHCEIWDGAMSVANDDVPLSVNVQPDKFYRVVISANGATWEKKIQAKSGMVASLWVHAPSASVSVAVSAAPPPPPAPAPPPPAAACMADGDFGSLKEAIEGESFSDGKLNVLRTAAGDQWFCVAQVGALLDAFSFSSDKLKALEAVKAHIVDRQNNFKIFSHFTFSADKEKAKRILAN